MRHNTLASLTLLMAIASTPVGLGSCGETGGTPGGDQGAEIPIATVDGANDLPFEPLDTADSTADLSNPDLPNPADVPDDAEDLGQSDVSSGEFGAPCSDNSECFSGFCVEAPGGSVCTKQCENSCPDGWKCKGISTGGSDQAFVCTPEHLTLCRPCHVGADCAWPGFAAAAICRSSGDAGSFCATPCDANSCPEGYTCEGGGGNGDFCVPAAGECTCDPFSRAQKLSTPCRVANDLGACAGLRTCGDNGLSGCDAAVPSADVCNGLDDDCDGVTDDGAGLAGQTCEVAGKLGACAIGSPLCESGQTICVQVATPTTEICNSLDDDCDGATDELGAGGCTNYFKDADRDGYGVETDSQCLCAPAAPYDATAFGDCDDGDELAAPGGTEVCDGTDNDCDGSIDPIGTNGCQQWFFDEDSDTFGHPNKSRCQCKAEGAYSTLDHSDCDDKDKTRYPGAAETCDGIDQDCDGAVDEKVNQKPGCAANCKDDLVCAKECALARACTTECGSGMEFCSGGAWKACDAVKESTCYDATNACEEFTTCSECPGPATDDCDGADSDCDGFTDEDFASATTACGIGVCMAAGVTSCTGAELVDSCTPNAAAATPEVCNGGDDDCDGQTDGADAELVLPDCALQAGVCAGAKMTPNMCVAASWPAECPEARYKAHNANYEAGQEASCDGLDNDCDGETDEDFTVASVDGSGELAIGAPCGTGACAGGAVVCTSSKSAAVCSTAGASAAETCNGVDDNCDGETDEGLLVTFFEDYDGDDYGSPDNSTAACDAPEGYVSNDDDCDDEDEDEAPDLVEICDDKDNDCDGTTDGLTEICDLGCGAGALTCSLGVWTDCVAPVPTECQNYESCEMETVCVTVCPPAPDETCNGIDDNCDGSTDEGVETTFYRDADVDEVGTADDTVSACSAPVGYVAVDGDCDDAKNTVKPGLAEACDGLDNDCNGATDEELGSTTCGQGACAHTESNCAGGVPQVCDPMLGATEEVCDGLDNDCNGQTDEGQGEITCGLGACLQVLAACAGGVPQTCDPLSGQAPELCNGIDDDCNGLTDEDLAPLSCGLGACEKTVVSCIAGASQTCDPLGGQTPESCDAVDNDCDGDTDELLGDETCGKGVCLHTIPRCAGGVIQVCDPLEGSGVEVCNSLDDDCDGLTDEDNPGGGGGCSVPAKLGLCAPGVYQCVAGSLVCSQTTFPAAETCDGVDNDCDGPADEDLGSESCGKGVCFHTIQKCQGGVTQTCNPFEGAGPETCDGTDNDCNGVTDEFDPQVGSPCTVGGKLGACAQGVYQCQGGALTCNQVTFPSTETCDGQDNDCDGATDENNPGGGGSCTVPGASGVCKTGQLQCQGGSLNCSQTVFGSSEQCDGLDNNCNGQTDEGNPQGGASCFVSGQQGECSKGQMQCQSGSLKCQQTFFGQSESCDGLDNDCNGQTDGYTQSCSADCGSGSRTCNFGSWTSCSGPPQVCSPGQACCSNDGCSYRSSSTKCDNTPYSSSYQCTSSSGCGGKAQRRDTYKYCTGSSASCTTGNLKQDSWTDLDSCSTSERCTSNSSSAQCLGCSSGQTCQSGSCVSVVECGNGTCESSETPSSCSSDCGFAVGGPSFYLGSTTVGTNGCGTQYGWHSGVSGSFPYWTWASSCTIPSASNIKSYSGYNARFTATVKKSGYYRVVMWVPCNNQVCIVNSVPAANRYASGVYWGISTASGNSGTISSALTYSQCGANTLFSSVYLNSGSQTIIAYDKGSSGNICNVGTSAANKWVFVETPALEWIGP
jgi:hypothetical protein